MAGRVVVIDGDIDTREMLRSLLGHAGHEVLVATTAEEGLPLVTAARPDLVITEFLIPDRSGRCVLEELRHRYGYESVPVIVWTATDTPEAAQRVRAAGGVYRKKPARLMQILPVVERLIGAAVREP